MPGVVKLALSIVDTLIDSKRSIMLEHVEKWTVLTGPAPGPFGCPGAVVAISRGVQLANEVLETRE